MVTDLDHKSVTPVLSMFAKADAIDLLKLLFGVKAIMTPKIRDEI